MAYVFLIVDIYLISHRKPENDDVRLVLFDEFSKSYDLLDLLIISSSC